MGDGRGLIGGEVPQQLQCELFEVMKVHDARLAFGLIETGGKLPRQMEQRRHRPTRPFPILGQRFGTFGRDSERREEGGFLEESFEQRLKFGFLSLRPHFARRDHLFQ